MPSTEKNGLQTAKLQCFQKICMATTVEIAGACILTGALDLILCGVSDLEIIADCFRKILEDINT